MTSPEFKSSSEPSKQETLPRLLKNVDLRAGWARSYLKKNHINPDEFIKKVTQIGIELKKTDLEKDEPGMNLENINLANAIAKIQQKAGETVSYDGMLGAETMLALDRLYARERQYQDSVVQRTALSKEVLQNPEELNPKQMEMAVREAKEKGEVLADPKHSTLIGGSLLNGSGVVASLPKGVNELGWNGASTKTILAEMKRLESAGSLEAKIKGCTILLDGGVGNDLMAGRKAEEIMMDLKLILELCKRNSPKKIILMTRPLYNLEVLGPVLKQEAKAISMQEENIKLGEAFRVLAKQANYELIDANKFTPSNFPTESRYGVHPKDVVFYHYVAMQFASLANKPA